MSRSGHVCTLSTLRSIARIWAAAAATARGDESSPAVHAHTPTLHTSPRQVRRSAAGMTHAYMYRRGRAAAGRPTGGGDGALSLASRRTRPSGSGQKRSEGKEGRRMLAPERWPVAPPRARCRGWAVVLVVEGVCSSRVRGPFQLSSSSSSSGRQRRTAAGVDGGLARSVRQRDARRWGRLEVLFARHPPSASSGGPWGGASNQYGHWMKRRVRFAGQIRPSARAALCRGPQRRAAIGGRRAGHGRDGRASRRATSHSNLAGAASHSRASWPPASAGVCLSGGNGSRQAESEAGARQREGKRVPAREGKKGTALRVAQC